MDSDIVEKIEVPVLPSPQVEKSEQVECCALESYIGRLMHYMLKNNILICI